jgi:hypothetical protein
VVDADQIVQFHRFTGTVRRMLLHHSRVRALFSSSRTEVDSIIDLHFCVGWSGVSVLPSLTMTSMTMAYRL